MVNYLQNFEEAWWIALGINFIIVVVCNRHAWYWQTLTLDYLCVDKDI